jgi:hypothetical protein
LDIFSKKEQNLDNIIHACCTDFVDTVQLGFVPKDCSAYEAVAMDEQARDEMLFLERDKTSLFEENKLMFPLLSHA